MWMDGHYLKQKEKIENSFFLQLPKLLMIGQTYLLAVKKATTRTPSTWIIKSENCRHIQEIGHYFSKVRKHLMLLRGTCFSLLCVFQVFHLILYKQNQDLFVFVSELHYGHRTWMLEFLSLHLSLSQVLCLSFISIIITDNSNKNGNSVFRVWFRMS